MTNTTTRTLRDMWKIRLLNIKCCIDLFEVDEWVKTDDYLCYIREHYFAEKEPNLVLRCTGGFTSGTSNVARTLPSVVLN